MKIQDISKSVEIVNGESLYIFDVEKWNLIKSNPVIDEVLVGGEELIKLVSGMVEFTKQHDEFSLACYRYKIGFEKWFWIFIELLKTDIGWQRIHIERISCESCGWEGDIANPTLPSLYDTVDNKEGALNSAWAHPVKNCPICGKKLQRFAIWTETTSR